MKILVFIIETITNINVNGPCRFVGLSWWFLTANFKWLICPSSAEYHEKKKRNLKAQA